jgi:hypothetical protein
MPTKITPQNGITPEQAAAVRETEEAIERTRERLAASVGALQSELSSLGDWREWVRRRPLAFVGGALALGLLLGSRAGR